MKLAKQNIACGEQPKEQTMALINRFAKTELHAEDVYLFSVRLCDNEVDRDGERFGRDALSVLAELFIGKSGIFDHHWSVEGQTARIYHTELCEENRLTVAGDRYCYLKGYAYMLRSEKNADLIAEIEAGIKKEVSVGCSVSRRICSICGQPIEECPHKIGESYDGILCFAELCDPIDAYEWSFVAVPAQREAGVMKRMQSNTSLRDFLKQYGTSSQQDALKRLEEEAECGKRYLAGLRQEVLRAMLVAVETLDGRLAERALQKMEEKELLELRRVFEAKTDEKVLPQLAGAFVPAQEKSSDAFCV